MKIQQAEYIEDAEMTLIWKQLRDSSKPKARETAVALAICYVTGARMGEALSLRYEDAKLKRDAGNTFYVFHLRVTKTDPFCKRMECLNLTLSTPHSIPLAEVIKGMFDNNKRGKRIYEKASNNAYNRPPIPGAEGRHQRSHGLHQAIRQKGRNRKRGKRNHRRHH